MQIFSDYKCRMCCSSILISCVTRRSAADCSAEDHASKLKVHAADCGAGIQNPLLSFRNSLTSNNFSVDVSRFSSTLLEKATRGYMTPCDLKEIWTLY
jgi:hypothetical protein